MRLKTAKDGMEGSYEPSYFIMKIDTSEKLTDNLDRHSQTFIHEYIHFIQDIFLPYCIRNNVNEVYRFVYVTDKAKEKPIERPFNEWNHELSCISRQYDNTWGNSKPIKKASSIKSYSREHYVIKEINARVFKYIAHLSSGMEYHVGAKDMLEYIAHKIEAKHWSTVQPDFPYRTMDFVFEELGLGDIPMMCKIALTEFCLHNDNPVHHLFEIIKTIRSEGFGFHGVQQCFYHFDILEYVLQRLLWGARGGFEETIHTKVERRLATIREYLSRKYPTDQFRDIDSWFGDVVSYVANNLKGRLYFSEIYEKNKSEFLAEIDMLISTLGIPLIFNSINEHISLLPNKYNKDSFIQFYASFIFNEFLKHTDKTCPMCSFCENTNASIMTDDCISNVMRRVAEDSQCPFGKFIYNHEIRIIS
ncbi:hypothetical protein NJH83_28350 [Pseudomonas chlororaphis]|uniref:hypothetical protein n=1 Tax=Pseudomonas chlororaphis TaxID=587753 RepID=UPI00209AA295|nr:hypothetical protein [Pseudomonas chlororaphis]MCO7614155.1 hypothetical protein [Pseudomonas chlororaphis]